MPELNDISVAGMKTGLGTLLSNPDETVKVIQANYPGVQVRQDDKGNYILKSSKDQKEYAVTPGLTVGDIPRVLSGVAAFTPAGRATTLAGAGATAAGTQAAIEASQVATGGEFNPADVALAGVGGAGGQAVAKGAQIAMPAVKQAATRVAQAAKSGKSIADVAKSVVPPKAPTPGTMASGGSAGTDVGTMRQVAAEDLPVPIKLTEGQKTRQFEQQRFEREAAKDPAIGEPIRQRFAEQNKQLQQNLDSFIDQTGAEATDVRSVGLSVDKALRDRAARDKTRIRTLYKDAEKAGEMEAPVSLNNVVQHLVDSAPEAEVANVLKATKAKALQLGIAVEDSAGNLVAQPVSLKTAELFRRSINGATNAESTNIRQAAIMKGLIDDATEGQGGSLYRSARAARSRYANDYENIGLVKNLLGTKRGTADRAIAMEDVLKRSIIDPSASLDTVRQMRRLLQTEGPGGQQAWRELQGGTLQHIKDEATKNVARDELGNQIVSAAQLDRTISALDRSGKLDFVFGKKGAEQLRTINDVAKDVLTAPPGAVNTSNTASVVLAALDMAISGTAGVPAPVLTSMRLIGKGIKDAKTKARVQRALGSSTN
jgi:hypothetical protein